MTDNRKLAAEIAQTKAQYAKDLAQREARTLADKIKSRFLGSKVPVTRSLAKPVDTLSDLMSAIKEKTNMENIVKKADGFDPRINAGVRGIMGNNKGFAKLLPMLGLGGAALAASSIFNKARAGDIPGAAMETADQVTDHIPGVGNLKMVVESSPLGEGEDKELAVLKQTQMAAQNPDERRFQKIRQLMGR